MDQEHNEVLQNTASDYVDTTSYRWANINTNRSSSCDNPPTPEISPDVDRCKTAGL